MRFSLRNRPIGQVVAGVALGVVFALTCPASAQFGEVAGIGESMQPDYYRRDVKIMADQLKLDDTQRVIVETLYQDYQTAFDQGMARAKEKINSLHDAFPKNDVARGLKMILAPLKEWGPERDRIGDRFLENVKMVLTDEQLERWAPLARRLYRDRHLNKGKLAGESLNLFDAVRELNLDERTSLQAQPMMDAYDIALDEALHHREAMIGLKDEMNDAMGEQDMQRQSEVMKHKVSLQVAVRNVNEQYIDLVASALPGNLAEQFRQGALERAFPRVYRETPIQRLFKEVKKIEGLDTGVLNSVTQLETSYLTELATANNQLRMVIRKFEPEEAIGQAEDFAKHMNGEQVQPKIDPSAELFTKREDMGRTYAKQLQGLLTPEQFAQLPGAYRWVEAPQPKNGTGPAANSTPKIRRPATDPGKPGMSQPGNGNNSDSAKNQQ